VRVNLTIQSSNQQNCPKKPSTLDSHVFRLTEYLLFPSLSYHLWTFSHEYPSIFDLKSTFFTHSCLTFTFTSDFTPIFSLLGLKSSFFLYTGPSLLAFYLFSLTFCPSKGLFSLIFTVFHCLLIFSNSHFFSFVDILFV